MAFSYPARQLQRDDRYLQRCHLRGAGKASRTQIQFYIEEALRLISLPQENEGRIYLFRKVTVTGVSPSASRQEWIGAIQTVLVDLCSRSVHGGDPRAADANVVFFQNHQEALELLLAKTLRGNAVNGWFWTQVIGPTEHSSHAEKMLAIIHRLSELPASWLAVADSVLAAIGSSDPLALLNLLPPSTAHRWLQELGPEHLARSHPRPVHLPQTVSGALLRSAQSLGSADPRMMWLAALAVVQATPTELGAGAVVGRARATLQGLVAERALLQGPVPRRQVPHPSSTAHDLISIPAVRAGIQQMAIDDSPPHPEALQFEGHVPGTRVRFTDAEDLPAQNQVGFPSHGSSPDPVMQELPALPAADRSEPRGVADTLSGSSIADASHELISGSFSQRASLDETTEAAGLFFLLNALSRLGIAETVAREPVVAEQGLVAHIMRRLALHAGVEARDTAWRWINLTLSQIPLGDARFPAGPQLFPANLFPRPGKLVDVQYLSRAWCVAVHRWCWHDGGITVRDVVNRRGLLSLNRTDLDVTLPLSSTELRIRRVGLDIDPGWLPWFGKVVRFHYV